MGIDDIILNREMCDRLYENVLVNTRVSPVHIPFEGKNQQKILVAFDTNGKLKKDDKDLLHNLMKACHLTMDDIALVNISEQEESVSDIIQRLHIRKAIFFGLPALSINLPLGNEEEIVIVHENCSFISTAPLGTLQNNVEKKKALWTALKLMFRL